MELSSNIRSIFHSLETFTWKKTQRETQYSPHLKQKNEKCRKRNVTKIQFYYIYYI